MFIFAIWTFIGVIIITTLSGFIFAIALTTFADHSIRKKKPRMISNVIAIATNGSFQV